MKDLVYPAILYKDDEKGSNTGWFTVSIPDLGIVTEGENVVDAFIKAKEYWDYCKEVGCDVEKKAVFHRELAEYVMTAYEIGKIYGLERDTEQQEMFFRLWTLKESYMKE